MTEGPEAVALGRKGGLKKAQGREHDAWTLTEIAGLLD